MSEGEYKKPKVKIAIFDGTGDFPMWKRRMLAHLSLNDLEEEVLPQTEEPDKLVIKDEESSESYAERVKADQLKRKKRARHAMDVLTLHLGDQVVRKTEDCTNARDLWKALERLYNTKTLPSRIHLMYTFYTFKMDGSKSIDQNVDAWLKNMHELASVGAKVPDEVQAILLLASLPPQYDPMKESLKYGRESITIDDVVNAAKAKEVELKTQGISTSQKSGEALVARGRQQNRDQRSGSRSRSRSKSSGGKLTCWHCNKDGHRKIDCYAWKKKKGIVDDEDATAAVVIDESIGVDALLVSDNWHLEKWVIDSGASYHMTSRRDWFVTFEELNSGRVLLADDGGVAVEGIGSININAKGGTVKTLTNVRYVPLLKRNLISATTLDKLGFSHAGGNGKTRFYKNGKLGLQGSMCGSLYLLDGETVTGQSNISVAGKLRKDETVLWHRRLGHMSMKNLMILVKRGILDKRKIGEMEFCESCVMGKTKKLSFNIGKHNSGEVLKYVHSDLWGSPSVTPSISGKQYFLSIIDDYTRKVWVFFLAVKSEAFTKFCEWKKLVENMVSKKVKCLRTDNGLEFVNNNFNEFCKQHGIERHKTCPYTPQQNGVAERMNRTIMEKVRCILDESGLGEEFWAEAVSTAVYQINRSPSSAIDGRIPEELWLGRKPGYEHMRRFGSLVYVHTDQGKLRPRAVKGIFTSYPEGVKGYKVWLLDESRCVISRNVVFVEDKVFKDLKNQEKDDDSEQKKQTSAVVSIDTPVGVDRHGSESTKKKICENSVDRQATPSVDRHTLSVDRRSPSVGRQKEPEVTNPVSEDGGQCSSSGGVVGNLDADDVPQEDTVDGVLLPKRISKLPVRYNDYDMASFALIAAIEASSEEPRNYQEAMESKDNALWDGGMGEEMSSLDKNKTWRLVKRPHGRKVIGCRWVYRLKPGIPGVEEPRYKARLVAKGYSQKEGIDYQDVFAPVVKHVSIRFLLSVCANMDLELEQLDVKTAFLHGLLEEEIYMEQPEGFVVKGKEDHVCLLQKALYGLKQAPRQWNKCFDQFVVSHGFKRSEFDHCVYIKESKGMGLIYLLLYVDDMLIASKDMKEIQMVKDLLSSRFEMKDLGAARRILGMDIERDREGGVITLSQSGYIKKVLQVFSMDESRSVATPIGSHFKLSAVKDDEAETILDDIPYSNAIGSIMYAMLGTRCDLAYAVGLVSRFMSKPSMVHWSAVKWVLRYLKGTQDRKMVFRRNKDFKVEGFCDSDFASDLDRSRSISGYVFTAGGTAISWKSSLQHVVALSTTEAEYMALVEAVKEAIWLQGLAEEFGFKQDSVEIWCDSQSALSLAKNNVHHERTKHINRRLHFIRDIVASGEVKLLKIPTERNPADMLTKVLPVDKFEKAVSFLNLEEH